MPGTNQWCLSTELVGQLTHKPENQRRFTVRNSGKRGHVVPRGFTHPWQKLNYTRHCGYMAAQNSRYLCDTIHSLRSLLWLLCFFICYYLHWNKNKYLYCTFTLKVEQIQKKEGKRRCKPVIFWDTETAFMICVWRLSQNLDSPRSALCGCLYIYFAIILFLHGPCFHAALHWTEHPQPARLSCSCPCHLFARRAKYAFSLPVLQSSWAELSVSDETFTTYNYISIDSTY